MSDNNKSLRIRTNVNGDSYVSVNLDQTYDSFEILSLKLKSSDMYKLHSSNYGVIAGRVLANESFGIPNAKISVFIEGDFESSEMVNTVYPYTSTSSKNGDGVRYNLLPDNNVDNCHQVVGSFPNKTYLLDNDVLIEVFDKYYVYTTRTNNSGDYIIMGVPVGNQTIHMDLDLSDCGMLSQRPRDFVYKGYTIEQFENPNQFKTSTNLDSLSQIFSQNQAVNVIPFWGNTENGESIGITRADINVAFKFEPTCVFIGSIVADNSSNGISKKCVPTNQMGAMDELTTGEGTIEMIRKTPGGDVEEFQIKGTQLIDGNGVWCYQIPMNLDYMMTDEYGNMVPTDDPDKGIPTRTRVRFRISMQDNEINTDNYFRAKVLVPHNPQSFSGNNAMHEEYDYEFGTNTKEDSFRDLMWNNVYTVKSYIPRFQKSRNVRTERFTGIKHCNIYGNNNPMPYNNIRIKLPLMFTILCALIKSYIRIVYVINNVTNVLLNILTAISRLPLIAGKFDSQSLKKYRYITIADGLCPDLENWYFAPVKKPLIKDINVKGKKGDYQLNVLKQTLENLTNGGEDNDPKLFDEHSTDTVNNDGGDNICLTIKTDYLISCIEMALAQEYKVINFDFYNDWVNGVIYMPRWMRFIRKKRNLLFGLINIKQKIKACSDDTSVFKKSRFYVQQCALSYAYKGNMINKVTTSNGCTKANGKKQRCHKASGKLRYTIFGGKNSGYSGNGGIVHETQTMKQQYVYYLKPCEWRNSNGKKTILFANDIVLLGSLLDCNMYGVPQAFKYLTSSSYIMPTNLALTNMDDDGQLYADEKGTICSGTRPEPTELEQMTEADINKYKLEKVNVSFSGTQTYYSTTSEENNMIMYGTNEDDNGSVVFDDTIPLTEAAGIAWNYTGPGQGEKSDNVKKSLYFPGGHFLGISCTNSETNIKSCVNLQRICEVGSNESQRREEIRSVEESNGGYVFNARYFVPTGFIANDEINGSEFRTMFATMNHRRLLCKDKVDDRTGYPVYDFVYLRNAGFDGVLADKINRDDNYNTRLDITDEYNTLGGNIARDSDEDINETGETYTRTIENGSVDYYKFRMGLEDLSLNEQAKRFLIVNNGYSLPQYENSFYFYFGLRNGSTAFDEFNKQFFSVCENRSILKRSLKLNVSDTPDTCALTSVVKLYGSDAVDGLKISYEYYDSNNVKQTVTIAPNQITQNGGLYEVQDLTLPFGSYTFIAIDDNMVESKQTIVLGSGSINAIVTTKDFEFKTTGMDYNAVSNKAKELSNGYIDIDDVTFDGVAPDNIRVTLVQKNKWGVVESYCGNSVPGVTMGSVVTPQTAMTENGGLRVYLWKTGVKYDLYLWNKCNKPYLNGSYLIEGIDSVDLFLGSYYFPYSTKLSTWDDGWWNDIGSDRGGVDNWLKRYAVFRRTEIDTEYYKNNVFGANTLYDTQMDTVLFGQPEIETNDGAELVNGYYYEDDTYEGAIDDSSIIPTWKDNTNVRANFNEMVVNDGVVASPKEGDVTVSDVVDRGDYYVVTTNGGGFSTNTGYIFKTVYGSIICGVGLGGNTFRYEGEMLSVGDTLSWYKTFSYPVMYKPFYVESYVMDWVSPYVSESNDLGYGNERYLFRMDIYNGLTYRGKFGETTFNGAPIDIDERTSDLVYPITKSMYYTDNIDNDVELVEGFDYSITEGVPTGLTEEQTQPFGVTPITVSQGETINCANRIIKKTDGGRTIFTNDTNDTEEDKYYLVKNITMPLVENGYVYKQISDNGAYIVCKIGNGFDTTGYNEVGSLVTVTAATVGLDTVFTYNYIDESGMTTTGIIYIANKVLPVLLNQLETPNGGLVKEKLDEQKLVLIKKYTTNNRGGGFKDYIDNIEEGIDLGTVLPITYGEPFTLGTVGANDYVVAYKKEMLSEDGKTNMKLIRIYPEIN